VQKLQFWSIISKYRHKTSKCGRVKPRSDIPLSFLIKYQKFYLQNSKLRIHSKPDRNQSKLTVCSRLTKNQIRITNLSVYFFSRVAIWKEKKQPCRISFWIATFEKKVNKEIQFWSNIYKYRLKKSKCGRVKPRSDIPLSFLIKYQKFYLQNSKLRIHSKPDRNQSKLTVCIPCLLCLLSFLTAVSGNAIYQFFVWSIFYSGYKVEKI
jgi:hypothetical protein